MFRSPLSRACCVGLSDHQLLQLASCRKDTGVLVLLVARRASKRLAIEAELLYYFAGYNYPSCNVRVVTTWGTWLAATPKSGAKYPNMHRLIPCVRACFIMESPNQSIIFWTFHVTFEHMCLVLKDVPGHVITRNMAGTYAKTVAIPTANALAVANLILEKC